MHLAEEQYDNHIWHIWFGPLWEGSRTMTWSLNISLLNSSAGVVFNDVYTASKFAIEGFCESMAVQLLKFNVK